MDIELQKNISEDITIWKDIKIKPNRFGTPSFFVNRKELCHFHSANQMDIRKPSKFNKSDNRIETNPYSDKWIMFNFNSREDSRDMLKIIKQSYEELGD